MEFRNAEGGWEALLKELAWDGTFTQKRVWPRTSTIACTNLAAGFGVIFGGCFRCVQLLSAIGGFLVRKAWSIQHGVNLATQAHWTHLKMFEDV